MRRLVILLAAVMLVLAQLACSDNGSRVEPVNTNLRSAAMCPAGNCE